MDKLLGDLSGTYVTLLCSLGDRLGLFKNLAESGSCTSAEFAGRMGMDERYLREWLGALTAAGYLEYDPLSLRFALPPEHALPLVKEGDLMFVAGLHQALLTDVKNLDRLAEAFKHGGGIPAEAYD